MKITSKFMAIFLALVVSTGVAAAAQVNVESGFVDPSKVKAGSTVQNQLFNVNIYSLSADGDTDYVYYNFPNRFEGNLSLNTVNSNVSISSSKKLVDYDNDSIKETVKVGLSRDGEGNITANVTLDATVAYSTGFDSASVAVHVVDSRNGEDTATLKVVDEQQDTTSGDQTSDNTGSESTDSTNDSTNDSNNDSTNSDTTQDSQNQGQNSESQSGGIISQIISFFTGLF